MSLTSEVERTPLAQRLAGLSADQRRLLSRLAAERNRVGDEGADGESGPALGRGTRRFAPSEIQRSMWHLAAGGQDEAYTFTSIHSVSGPMNLSTLRSAVLALSRHHQILRVVLEEEAIGLVAVERPLDRLDLTVVDLMGLDAAVQESLIRHHRPTLDLRAGQVMAVTVFRLAPERSALSLSLHHGAYDGWSLQVLAEDLASGYGSSLAGRPIELPPASGYEQYADVEAAALDSLQFEPAASMWSERLSSAAATHVPVDHSAPRSTGVWSSVRVVDPSDIETRSRELLCTRAAYVMAAVGRVVARWCGTSGATLTIPVANRAGAGLERTVGNLTSLVPLVVSDGDMAATASEVQRQLADQARHLIIPYRAMQASGLIDAPPTNSLSSVLCLMAPPRPPLKLPGLLVEPSPAGPAANLAPVVVEIVPDGDSLQLAVHLDRSRFTAATADLLVDGIESELVGRPVPAAEPLDGGPPPAVSWTDRVDELLSIDPDWVVAIEGGRHVTRRGLALRGEALLSAIGGRGRAPAVLGLHLPRGLDYLALLVAALRSGWTVVPLDVDLPPGRLAELVDRSGVDVVVVGDGRRLPGLEAELVSIPTDRPAERSAVTRSADVHPQQAPVILATSGSTGSPLLVETTWAALDARLAWAAPGGDDGEQRVLGKTSIAFVDSLAELLGPIASRSRVVLASGDDVRDPARLTDRLVSEAITALTAVPTLLMLMIDRLDQPGLRAVERVISSGEPLPGGLVGEIVARLPRARLLDLYGSSETGGDNLTSGLARAAPDGVFADALPGSRAQVVDRWLEPTGVRAVGQLAVGGSVLANGYRADPRRTADRFRPDAGRAGRRNFLTGDRALSSTAGIAVLGRIDGQISVRGTRVDPTEVEWHLRAAAGTPETLVGLVDGGRAPELVAVLAGSPSTAIDADIDRIRARLRRQLPLAACPVRFYQVEALPRTATGKADRRNLAELVNGLVPLAPSSAGAYRGDWEELIGACFEEALGLVDLGRLADFFELGGHSVVAADLVALIRRRSGREVGLADLLASPTVAELAATVAVRPVTSDRPPPPPASVGAAFPLTPVQRAYLVGRSTGAALGGVGSHAYSEHDFVNLDVDRLEAALTCLVARHPMLRTVIDSPDEQRVLSDTPPIVVEFEDLTDLDDDRRRHRLVELRDRLSHRVWQAGDWPLFDVRATALTDRTTRVHFSVDALICDVASYSVLIDELRTLYDDPQAQLPPIGCSFAEIVQGRLADRSSRRAADTFWNHRIPSLPAGPDLPLNVGPTTSPRRFARLSGHLGPDRWNRLGERARAMGVTPSALVLTAFGDVLARWCQRGRFTVVLTTFDRPSEPGLERLVGDFTSLVLIELGPGWSNSIAQRAQAVQRELWSGLDHAAVDGVEVIGRWARHHERAADGAMPVVFTSTIDVGPAAATGGPLLDGEEVFAITQTPQVLIDHQVGVVDGTLRFNWDHVPSAFPAGMVDDMWECYLDLLDQLSSPTSEPRTELPRRQRDELARANDTGGPVPEEPLHAGVLRRLLDGSDDPAVVTGDAVLSYRDLGRRVGALAAELSASGLGVGSIVAVGCPKGIDQVVAVLAASQVGATWLPIDPDLPERRLDLLHDVGRPDMVLVSADDLVARGRAPFIDVAARRAPASIDSVAMMAKPSPADPAYIIFTSGTTGIPKGVVISHRSARNTIDDINRRFGVSATDRVLGISALSFDLAVSDLFGTLAAGATLVLPDPAGRRNPSHWLHLCSELDVTIWNSVPALLQLALEADVDAASSGLRSLRLAMLSGDWIPPDLGPALRRRVPGVAVVSLGGATEASIWSVSHPIGEPEPDWPSVPYGFPLTNQTLHVLDEAGRDRPEWVAGELYIGGVGVARGYHGDPELTAERFPPGPDGGRLYRTGDLARRRPGGILEFLGRFDGQVKISGIRLELGEVESALREDPLVAEALVSVVSDRDGSKRLVAYVVGRGGRPPDLRSVRERLRARLPAHAVPGFILTLERFPLTANGKVDRGALPDPREVDGRRSPDGPAGGSGEGELEPLIGEIWAAALDLPSVERATSFWDAGGTSAIAISMMRQLGERLDRELTLGLLYEHPTIARLAVAIGGQTIVAAGSPEPADPGGEETEPFPLTAVQEAYWLGRRAGFDLAGASAHNYFELDVVDLDLDRFQRSLAALVTRHSMLRTIILPDGMQRTLAEVPEFEVPTVDLRSLDPQARHDRLSELRQQWAHRRYDPERWPLFGVRAILVDRNVTRLQVSIDLIVVDTHCLLIVQRDLLRIYENDGVDPVPPPGCTFRDYVLATRIDRTSTRYRRDVAYWDEVAASLPPPPALPYRRRSAELGPVFERLQFDIESVRWSALKASASANEVTPTAFLLSALGEVILQWSGWQPFTINLPTLSRVPIHPDIEDVVGDFTSTTLVAVPAEPAGVPARARAIQSQLWAAIDHGSLSGVEVLRRRRQREPEAPLLMPIVFTSQLDYPTSSDEELPALEVERVYGLTQTAQVLLDAQASEHDGMLFFSVDYVPLAFVDGVVPAMVDRFRAILEELT